MKRQTAPALTAIGLTGLFTVVNVTGCAKRYLDPAHDGRVAVVFSKKTKNVPVQVDTGPEFDDKRKYERFGMPAPPADIILNAMDGENHLTVHLGPIVPIEESGLPDGMISYFKSQGMKYYAQEWSIDGEPVTEYLGGGFNVMRLIDQKLQKNGGQPFDIHVNVKRQGRAVSSMLDLERTFGAEAVARMEAENPGWDAKGKDAYAYFVPDEEDAGYNEAMDLWRSGNDNPTPP